MVGDKQKIVHRNVLLIERTFLDPAKRFIVGEVQCHSQSSYHYFQNKLSVVLI